eukprot:2245698-Prymnesium_polylepis.1
MSGWDVLQGTNKRTGARVIESAELRGIARPPRAGPSRLSSLDRDTRVWRTCRTTSYLLVLPLTSYKL